MKKFTQILMVMFALVVSSFSYSVPAANPSSPIGYWQTIDDVTNKPKSILEISEQPNHTFAGKVVKIYPRPGYDENEVCSACEGEKHNQRIVGMVVLEDLKPGSDKNSWVNGTI